MAVVIGLSECINGVSSDSIREKNNCIYIYICKWYIIGKFENMLFSEYE
jgi:hypothetical protein